MTFSRGSATSAPRYLYKFKGILSEKFSRSLKAGKCNMHNWEIANSTLSNISKWLKIAEFHWPPLYPCISWELLFQEVILQLFVLVVFIQRMNVLTIRMVFFFFSLIVKRYEFHHPQLSVVSPCSSRFTNKEKKKNCEWSLPWASLNKNNQKMKLLTNQVSFCSLNVQKRTNHQYFHSHIYGLLPE